MSIIGWEFRSKPMKVFDDVSTTYRGYLLRGEHAQLTKFVIFSQPRSGTTLLVDLLASHPQIHCEHEILGRRVLFPKLYVMAHAQQAEPSTYGFKLMAEQLVRTQNIPQPEKFLSGLYESGFKVIYLRRIDVVRQALSSMYASDRDIHHVRACSANLSMSKIRVDFNKLMTIIRDIQIGHMLAEYMLQGVPYLRLYYENDLLLQERHQSTVDTITEYLGISHSPVATALIKATPTGLEDFVENVDELIQFMKDKGYDR